MSIMFPSGAVLHRIDPDSPAKNIMEKAGAFECDENIAPLIQLLNYKGYGTRFCCSGHPYPEVIHDEKIDFLENNTFYVVFDRVYPTLEIALDEVTGLKITNDQMCMDNVLHTRIGYRTDIDSSDPMGIIMDYIRIIHQIYQIVEKLPGCNCDNEKED